MSTGPTLFYVADVDGRGTFRFLSRWRIEGTLEEVAEILTDLEALSAWWPSTFLRTDVLHAGDRDRSGAAVEAECRGWLPYRLHNRFELVEVQRPHRCVVRCRGDLDGLCECRGEQRGRWAVFDLDWRVRAQRPLVRRLARIVEPLAVSNHLWVMRTGEQRLRAEVARRRGEPSPARSSDSRGIAALDAVREALRLRRAARIPA